MSNGRPPEFRFTLRAALVVVALAAVLSAALGWLWRLREANYRIWRDDKIRTLRYDIGEPFLPADIKSDMERKLKQLEEERDNDT
jgi:hypothetical protein